MKICLDVRYKTESGASSYIRNVVTRVLQLDRVNEYLLVKYRDQKLGFETLASEVLECPSSNDVVHMAWSSLQLPRLLSSRSVTTYHAMKMPATSKGAASNVVTMHSIFDPYKGEFPVNLKTRVFLSSFARAAIARADRIIAVSDFVKDYLMQRHGIKADAVDVIYNGVDEAFRVLPSVDAGLPSRKWQIQGQYVLCVGNVTPVKNHVTAIRAFAEIANQVPHSLVIAGNADGDYAREAAREAGRCGVADRVRFLGFVHRDDLVLLMNGAAALVFPSLTEGCPVTMLEAFGCGLPIVATRRGGLWDLGRDVARFVEDPLDWRGFAHELALLLRSPALLEEHRNRSLNRANDFSWTKAARDHIRVYELAGTPAA